MKERARAVFADAPVLFFAVVIGVALTFRVAVGAVRDAVHPEPVAPTFATGASEPIVTGPEPGLARGTGAGSATTPTTTTSATSTTSAAEVGAAAGVQPIGTPSTSLPAPVLAPPRFAPKRGHGRRPIRGGDR